MYISDKVETANQESINSILPENLTTYIEQQYVGCIQMLPYKRKTSADYCREYRTRKKIRENSANPKPSCSMSTEV